MPTPILALHHIHFSRAERPILTDINWAVQPGQIAAILGPNGCGKSTLLRIACAYLWPQKGRVELLGKTLGEVPVAPLREQIGILEATTIYPFDDTMTALDVATSGYFSALTLGYITPTNLQREHAGHLLTQVGLASHADQLYCTLSTGERLRALLARALVRKPKLLLLDEPTAGLDLPAREAVLATLARLHRNPASFPPAIVTVTHHLEELLPGTENILLLSGAGVIVAAGPTDATLTNSTLSAAYNVPIQLTRLHGRYHAHVDPATWDELL